MNETGLTTLEQLQQLKALTVRFGSIHEAQGLQLKMWPFLFPGVSQSEVMVDPETRTVAYKCLTFKGKGIRRTKNNLHLGKVLTDWTQKLLWDDTRVVITMDGKPFLGETDETQT